MHRHHDPSRRFARHAPQFCLPNGPHARRTGARRTGGVLRWLSPPSFLGARGKRLYHVTVLPGLDVAALVHGLFNSDTGFLILVASSSPYPSRCLLGSSISCRLARRKRTTSRSRDEARLEGSHPVLPGGSAINLRSRSRSCAMQRGTPAAAVRVRDATRQRHVRQRAATYWRRSRRSCGT